MSRPAARFFRSGTRSSIRASSFCVRAFQPRPWGGEQFGELFAVENHSAQDGVDERLQCIEPPAAGGGIVLFEDGIDDGAFGERFAGFDLLALRLVVVDMEAKDVAIFDGVGDGVFVQRFLK
jgi:hypothetical protein